MQNKAPAFDRRFKMQFKLKKEDGKYRVVSYQRRVVFFDEKKY
jgi:hypothetical protein